MPSLLSGLLLLAAAYPLSVSQDPTAPVLERVGERVWRFTIPAGDAMLPATAYLAPGPGPHPTVLRFTAEDADPDPAGFRALTDTGWNVVIVRSRGRADEVPLVLDFLRSPPVSRALRLDPARLVLDGAAARGGDTLRTPARATDLEEIVVVSTRTGRRIEDEPVRVEVLGREEIEEKLLMTPGDISMMLNETSGLRVQTTSPALGGATVRVNGLRGRYTQVLSDGLPLYGGQSGALSILQIPPMDLRQVEVIKGIASALYGPSALGGVVNLISRLPDGEREVLVNQTTRGGSDAVLWSSGSLSPRWGYTLLAGAHRQGMHDVDGDDWADLPGYRRGVLRPRLFFDDDAGRSLLVTLGTTLEGRDGGTVTGAVAPDGAPWAEGLDTRRLDGGMVGRMLLGGRLLSVRASMSGQWHDHRIGPRLERDRHVATLGEVTLTGSDRGHTWVVGAAFQHEAYRATDVPRFDYIHTAPSLFVQDEVSPREWLTVAASARLDRHNVYGTILSPRVSVLARPDDVWTVRLSTGTGWFAPTPHTEETAVTGLERVEFLRTIRRERARTASLDVGRTLGPVELNATLFGAVVLDPVQVRRLADGRLELMNAPGPVRAYGADLLARVHREPLHLTATYTWTRSTERDPLTSEREETPLTPRHAVGLVGMWELEGKGRVGLELYYVGRQRLDENPYRITSRPYVITGVLAERRFGRARVFLNAENLLDARQTRHDPLLLPGQAPDGRWATDVWAPLEGRTFNAGVRLAW